MWDWIQEWKLWGSLAGLATAVLAYLGWRTHQRRAGGESMREALGTLRDEAVQDAQDTEEAVELDRKLMAAKNKREIKTILRQEEERLTSQPAGFADAAAQAERIRKRRMEYLGE